jgi:hypothetical protein
MSSIAALADSQTVIVQMIAFSERRWQLPRYPKTMEEVGLQEMFLPLLFCERYPAAENDPAECIIPVDDAGIDISPQASVARAICTCDIFGTREWKIVPKALIFIEALMAPQFGHKGEL